MYIWTFCIHSRDDFKRAVYLYSLVMVTVADLKKKIAGSTVRVGAVLNSIGNHAVFLSTAA